MKEFIFIKEEDIFKPIIKDNKNVDCCSGGSECIGKCILDAITFKNKHPEWITEKYEEYESKYGDYSTCARRLLYLRTKMKKQKLKELEKL